MSMAEVQEINTPLELEGIHFMTDTAGKRIAVIIDLEQYGELMEDFFDVVISRMRLKEAGSLSLDEFKQELIREGRLQADV